jgi:signal transduction histidine kinase
MLLAVLALLLTLILVGAWFIGRAVTQELAVAKLQSDFVSAVSHEFRTPLTSLCQLSELLMRDRVASEGDRREYYRLLYSESHRLRRMVEGLLNFGRLEANRMQFHFAPVDAAAFVRQTAAEFDRGGGKRPVAGSRLGSARSLS